MKNLLTILAVLAIGLSVCCFGCAQKVTETTDAVSTETSKILETTDKLYAAIKVVVTDEEIATLIDADDLAALKEIEEAYLAAKAILETDITDEGSLLALAECAENVLVIIGKEALTEKYGTEITAIRLGIKVLLSVYTT